MAGQLQAGLAQRVGGSMSTGPKAVTVALRAYTTPVKKRKRRKKTGRTGWSKRVLIFDTETTTDPTQRLTFGSYRVCRWDGQRRLKLVERGLFHADELPDLDPAGFQTLERFAEDRPDLILRSRMDFVEAVFYRMAWKAHALVVGFNLPFDLSRLAVDWGEARLTYRGGFSLQLCEWNGQENPFRPRICIKHVDSKRAFIGFARSASVDRRNRFPGSDRGYFLDLRTFAFALSNGSFSLASACEAFGVERGKLETESHGVITPEYIEYNLRDTEATGALLEQLREEFDQHPIELAPWKAYSPASVAKAYDMAMGIEPPRSRFSGVGKAFLGKSMAAYYGGRAEARIRKTPVPVMDTDFVSMYPTVNASMGNWEYVTAKEVVIEESTKEVRELLDFTNIDDWFDPTNWRKLRFFAVVEPDADILPVRAEYGSAPGFNIGLNRFTSDNELVYVGPDLVASALLTGKPPKIKKAWRLVPRGTAENLKEVDLRGSIPVDPTEDDFFRFVIEERKRVEASTDLTPEERSQTSKFLKVLANSGSYGIFAEMNRRELPKKEFEPTRVYGLGPSFIEDLNAPEEPGRFCFPPLAALITSGARLMLALLECSVRELGGSYAFCDTDSMAIVASEGGGWIKCPGGDIEKDGKAGIRALSWAEAESVVQQFERLNPYDRSAVPGSILKIEEVNFEDGKQRQLYAYTISAKRYALFVIDEGGEPRIVKHSDHGLGHLMDPISVGEERRTADGSLVWTRGLWELMIREELGLPTHEPEWLDRPALSRFTASSPLLLRRFKEQQEGLRYADQIKPFNFILAAHVAPLGHPVGVDPTSFQLIAPYETDPEKWADLPWIDRDTGECYPITTDRPAPPGAVRVKSYRGVLESYATHPEPKSAAPDGSPCSQSTVGLLRRREIVEGSRVYIGKESNKLEEVQEGRVHDLDDVQQVFRHPGDDPWENEIIPELREVPRKELAGALGVSERTVTSWRQGHSRPREATRKRVLEFLADR